MTTQEKINNLQKQLYKEQCADHLCCVCGKQAVQRYMSIMGQWPFYVCLEHYKTTSPAMTEGRMGLVTSKNGKTEWLALPFLGEKNKQQ